MRLSLQALLACLFLLPLSFSSKAQDATPASETLISSTTLSKQDQWHNLRRWVALTFDNSNVIDMEDPERGTMVIKWSCPIKLDSECIGATAVSIYVIDVRDGKYRLQRINPRISFQFSRPDIYEEYDQARSERITADFRLINGVASRMFEGSFEWPANERYDEVIDAYRETLANTGQYRTERDRDRGKISDEWKKAERNWQLIRTPLTTLRQLDAAMVKSLDDALKHNDDF